MTQQLTILPVRCLLCDQHPVIGQAIEGRPFSEALIPHFTQVHQMPQALVEDFDFLSTGSYVSFYTGDWEQVAEAGSPPQQAN